MLTIGLDLAVAGTHKAVVLDDATNCFVSPVLTVSTRPADLDLLLQRSRQGADAEPLRVVLEPTGWAWFPVAVYMARHGVQVYLVKTQQVADLRKVYSKHAKSDRIDARVLARLPLVNPDGVHPLSLTDTDTLACQRGCRELDRVMEAITASKNRLQAIDRAAWLGLLSVVFSDKQSAALRWFREQWYNPSAVVQAGAETIRQQWHASGHDAKDDGKWVTALVSVAQEVLALYGPDGRYLDFDLLQAEVQREQDFLMQMEARHHDVRMTLVRPLYRKMHPSRNLETIMGVGQDGAAVYASFIGNVQRFGSGQDFRGWSGMVPDSKQSSNSEAKGLHITKAGPDLIKKFAYIDADTARQRDPQIAAIYYEQMVHKGKHHTQAVCACATHLLDRVYSVLRDDRPYVLRDGEGHVVTAGEALAIIATRYTVPKAVRQRLNKNARRARADRRAERKERGKAPQDR
jgi:transposase